MNISSQVMDYLKLFGLENFGGSNTYSLGGLAGILQIFLVAMVMKGHNGGAFILDMIKKLTPSFPSSSNSKPKPSEENDKPSKPSASVEESQNSGDSETVEIPTSGSSNDPNGNITIDNGEQQKS